MPDFIVKDAEGNESSVTVPEGYSVLSQSDLTERLSSAAADDPDYMLKSSWNRRIKNYVKRDEAHLDDDIVSSVLRDNKVESSGIDEDALKSSWNTEIGDPLRKENSHLSNMIKGAAIREAFRDVLDERFTRPGPTGGPSWAEMEFGNQVGIDKEKGRVLALREDGDFRPSRSADNRGYMTVQEFAKVVSENEAYKSFLAAEPKGGSGADAGDQNVVAGSKGDVDLLDVLKEGGRDAFDKALGR